MFFRLNSLCQLITGENVSIYNLKENIVYILNKEAGEFIKYCEENNEIEEYTFYKNNKQYLDEILFKLENLNLGCIVDKKIHIEKFKFNTSEKLLNLIQPPPFFNKVILNYSKECNLNCDFCNKENLKIWQGCVSCFQNHEEENIIGQEQILSIVEKLKPLNINELVIKGGNPLIKIDILEAIINNISSPKNIKVKIISNGLGIEYQQLIKLLSSKSVELQIVLFGLEQFIDRYDFDHYMREIIREQNVLIDKLIRDNIDFNITFQVLRQNQTQSVETINTIREKYNKKVSVSNLIYEDDQQTLAIIKHSKKFIPKLNSPKEFFWNKSHNRCLYGTFCINSNHKLTPCSEIMEYLGDIGEDGENIYNVLSNSKLYDYWNENKNDIENCKSCSLRYFCLDCYAIDKSCSRKTICNILLDDMQIDYSKIDDKEFIKTL